MSPRDALALLDNVASAYNGPRQDHVNLQTAISVLRGVVERSEQEVGSEKAAIVKPKR